MKRLTRAHCIILCIAPYCCSKAPGNQADISKSELFEEVHYWKSEALSAWKEVRAIAKDHRELVKAFQASNK